MDPGGTWGPVEGLSSSVIDGSPPPCMRVEIGVSVSSVKWTGIYINLNEAHIGPHCCVPYDRKEDES